MTPSAAPPSQLHLDKVLHMIAYAVVTFGLIFAKPRTSLPLLFSVSFGVGLLLEILQGTVAHGRTASLADALANGAGALTVIALWILVWSFRPISPAKRD